MADWIGIAKIINDEMVKVLEQQDHKFKGHLINSIKDDNNIVVTETEDAVTVEMYGASHWKYMHYGVTPEQIKYPFAKKRIFALTNWVQVKKNLTLGEAMQKAYAIAAYHSIHGMPNPKATSTDFVGIAFRRIDKEIMKKIDFEIGKKVR